ncbi:MAG TPA: PKD domain-containing protein [Actinophytocola sp.]|uniref:PKD domain-containing protein n=1 Tax=Actinophytocola sp. TaxID=1872138 RepID=UPI002DBF2796|nr:PKD domain-containing protein [Actinophytocola sp.]HEU5470999.1 PKD domain-containing protein [Actinophytocola sp.]
MTLSTARRSWITGLAAAAIAFLAPGVAQAQPPANDDFDSATVITALPFSGTQDTAGSTVAPDDPPTCNGGFSSVWFRYTAPADGIVKATAVGSSPLLSAYTGERGQLTPVPGVCVFARSETFHVTAGTTYHILVRPFGGSLTMNLESVPPSPNDDFAAAEAVTGIPATPRGDLARASAEPGEPTASCDGTAAQSVWYSYTPPTPRWVSAVALGGSATVTVYRGGALSDLSEVDCVVGGVAVFRAEVGQAYHIRVAADAERADLFDLRVASAPPLTPFISGFPSPASVFDEVTFFPGAGDQLNQPIVSGEVRFGDGASTPITGNGPVQHRYAADGVYRVEVSVSTADGRSGTGATDFVVETHDVSIARFTVPASARADQTKPITVSIANTRRDETVSVELFKQNGDFFTRIGRLTQWVPARPGRTVEFPFAYTFSAADATAGTVTFKAVATLADFTQDDRPADNESLGTTRVR